MTLNRLTWPAFVLAAAVLAAWEAVVIVAEARRRGGPRVRTISQVVKEEAKRWTVTPYVWGALGSHYFPPWPSRADVFSDWGYGVAIGLAVVLLAVDVALRRRSWDELPRFARWARWPFGWFLVGLVVGAFLFVQRTVQPWEGP